MSARAHDRGSGPRSQQQARLEIGEPRRHHQIVGGKLEAQFPHLLDEGEVLVGQRQDRDLGEVDLLLARQRQQQIERPFEALDVDDQRRLVGGELGRRSVSSCTLVRRHQRHSWRRCGADQLDRGRSPPGRRRARGGRRRPAAGL